MVLRVYMSLNQSMFDKNESQFRKPGGGRSGNSGGQQRNFTGTRGRGGGGGPNPTTAPPVPINRGSYKKVNNAPGGQTRGVVGPVNASDLNAGASSRSVENGGHVQSTLHVSSAPTPAVISKPADASSQKSSRPLPKAPSSQSSSMSSDSSLPSTPAKAVTGLVQRKPGRGAITSSVSCSDKIARWNVVGIQDFIKHR